MKKILLTAVSMAALSGAAFAADLPNRKQAPAPIVAPRSFLWNGVYTGLNGGYLSTDAHGGGSSIVGNDSPAPPSSKVLPASTRRCTASCTLPVVYRLDSRK